MLLLQYLTKCDNLRWIQNREKYPRWMEKSVIYA